MKFNCCEKFKELNFLLKLVNQQCKYAYLCLLSI